MFIKMSPSSPSFLVSGLLLAGVILQAATQPLSRIERQTLARELGTGLTGTGTSFSSMYDPYSGYPQQQTNIFDGQKAYDPDYYGNGVTAPMIGGFKNRMGLNGIGVEYDPPLTTPISGVYPDYSSDRGLNRLNGRDGWKGFGAGKDPYGYGRGYGTKGGYDGVKRGGYPRYPIY